MLLGVASATDTLVSLVTHVIRDLRFAGVFAMIAKSGSDKPTPNAV
jgi:hypothetical protein